MMQRFQEDTVKYLYLMQIIERPRIESGAAGDGSGGPQLSPGGQGPGSGAPAPHGSDGNGKRPPRMVSTSADELEEAFMRRKRRELEQARMAGAGDTPQVQQVVRGQEKVGRNDPCPCGSGKKYKKCHGV
jgi:preprotein translocase subunit SecA